MRDLRLVSKAEFDAFVNSYRPALTTSAAPSGLVTYTDTSDGSVWPESLVASYVASTPSRPRATGWRIPVENL